MDKVVFFLSFDFFFEKWGFRCFLVGVVIRIDCGNICLAFGGGFFEFGGWKRLFFFSFRFGDFTLVGRLRVF